MRPNYSGYRPSKKDDSQIIKDNLIYEYQEYLGNMTLKQLKIVAESNSFELKARTNQ
jgi:hypothetical protein